MLGVRKAFEIANFHQHRQSGCFLNAFEADELLNRFMVGLSGSQFLNPLIQPFHLIEQLIIGYKVLCQDFLIQSCRL